MSLDKTIDEELEKIDSSLSIAVEKGSLPQVRYLLDKRYYLRLLNLYHVGAILCEEEMKFEQQTDLPSGGEEITRKDFDRWRAAYSEWSKELQIERRNQINYGLTSSPTE
jgi:hypothetical protein